MSLNNLKEDNSKSCNCIEEINKEVFSKTIDQIKGDDTSDVEASLDTSLFIDKNRTMLVTSTNISISYNKKDKLKKAKSVWYHTFCPFCGVKYDY